MALITNAGPAHLEGFGSVENVSRAKAEIYGGLDEQGVAIINLDDDFSGYWCDVCRGKTIVSFSMQNKSADVFVEAAKHGAYVFHTPSGSSEIKLLAPGRHNVMNALAATASCLQVGVALEDVVAALSKFSGVPGRLSVTRLSNGTRLIDDTYNANPSSFAAAIDVLVESDGDSWLVLGDMSELGNDVKSLHFDIGKKAKAAGVNKLFAIGNHSQEAVKAFGEGAEFFDDRNKLTRKINNEMDGNVVILVKGSRVMKMEKIVNVLLSDNKKIKQETA